MPFLNRRTWTGFGNKEMHTNLKIIEYQHRLPYSLSQSRTMPFKWMPLLLLTAIQECVFEKNQKQKTNQKMELPASCWNDSIFHTVFWFFDFLAFLTFSKILIHKPLSFVFSQKIKKPKILVISIGYRPIYFCFLILNQ